LRLWNTAGLARSTQEVADLIRTNEYPDMRKVTKATRAAGVKTKDGAKAAIVGVETTAREDGAKTATEAKGARRASSLQRVAGASTAMPVDTSMEALLPAKVKEGLLLAKEGKFKKLASSLQRQAGASTVKAVGIST